MTVHVVIADDQQLVRAGFRMILADEPDIEVVGEASNGAEAVVAAAELCPDVVLMDIRMPEVDGIEATRQIVSRGGTPKTSVLILTTFDLDEYVYDALRVGASGFLLKDAPAHQLIAGVRMVSDGDALLAPSITRRLIEEFSLSRAPISVLPGFDALDPAGIRRVPARRPRDVQQGDCPGADSRREHHQDPRDSNPHEARGPGPCPPGGTRVRGGYRRPRPRNHHREPLTRCRQVVGAPRPHFQSGEGARFAATRSSCSRQMRATAHPGPRAARNQASEGRSTATRPGRRRRPPRASPALGPRSRHHRGPSGAQREGIGHVRVPHLLVALEVGHRAGHPSRLVQATGTELAPAAWRPVDRRDQGVLGAHCPMCATRRSARSTLSAALWRAVSTPGRHDFAGDLTQQVVGIRAGQGDHQIETVKQAQQATSGALAVRILGHPWPE